MLNSHADAPPVRVGVVRGTGGVISTTVLRLFYLEAAILHAERSAFSLINRDVSSLACQPVVTPFSERLEVVQRKEPLRIAVMRLEMMHHRGNFLQMRALALITLTPHPIHEDGQPETLPPHAVV
jgi:hypothetical protein